MRHDELERIRENISCPEFGDKYWGRWGCLNAQQRRAIYRMLGDINCKNAQIERLYREYDSMQREIKRLEKRLANAKAEAIKEFAERIKQKTLAMIYSPDEVSTDDYVDVINSVVKEMVGDE